MPVRQTALFRTKGRPGLNAPATPGGDLAPFVEAAYPRSPERLLYRDEPILLAMNERFSPLAPGGRRAAHGAARAPPAARVVDARRRGRRGRPRHDRDLLEPGLAEREPVAAGSARAARLAARRRCCRTCGEARSLDPRFVRLDAINRSPANCQPHDPSLHTSRDLHVRARPTDGWAHGVYRARSCSAAARTRCGRRSRPKT